MSQDQPLLEVENLTIKYRTNEGAIHAVTDASFKIGENEFFGLVGESGSGKSTAAKALIGGLDENGEITSGTIKYKGKDLADYTEKQLNNEIRWQEIALIPQASMNSLDPIMRMDQQAVELAETHTDWDKEKAIDRLQELFDVVGLPEDRVFDYPHQFSGGMQQRAIIALSLFLNPSILIADEPTTALDVIMQDQIMKHMIEIKEEEDVSMLLITHDISVIFENCDSLAVLHGGIVAELGNVYDLFDNPRHPYTILLKEAFPDIRFPDRNLEVIEGKPPQLEQEVDYCTFVDRCPWAKEECRLELPDLVPLNDNPDQYTSCIRSHEMEDLASEYLENSEEAFETEGIDF